MGTRFYPFEITSLEVLWKMASEGGEDSHEAEEAASPRIYWKVFTALLACIDTVWLRAFNSSAITLAADTPPEGRKQGAIHCTVSLQMSQKAAEINSHAPAPVHLTPWKHACLRSLPELLPDKGTEISPTPSHSATRTDTAPRVFHFAHVNNSAYYPIL